MYTQVSIFAAFLAGLLAFLSPCVLPLIPAYISYVSGLTIAELKSKKVNLKVITHSLLFILGFSSVFVSMGASATFLGSFLIKSQFVFDKMAGILIIIFGLHFSGFFKIRFLNYEERFHLKEISDSPGVAFLLGVAFAFGWTPCIGPILASILIIASRQETAMSGVVLLSSFSLGLGIPFLVAALIVDRFFIFFDKIKKYFNVIEIVAGLLLILLGLLIFFEQMGRFTSLFL